VIITDPERPQGAKARRSPQAMAGPCQGLQPGRKGGIFEEPRRLLRAATIDFLDMSPNRWENSSCGVARSYRLQCGQGLREDVDPSHLGLALLECVNHGILHRSRRHHPVQRGGRQQPMVPAAVHTWRQRQGRQGLTRSAPAGGRGPRARQRRYTARHGYGGELVRAKSENRQGCPDGARALRRAPRRRRPGGRNDGREPGYLLLVPERQRLQRADRGRGTLWDQKRIRGAWCW